MPQAVALSLRLRIFPSSSFCLCREHFGSIRDRPSGENMTAISSSEKRAARPTAISASRFQHAGSNLRAFLLRFCPVCYSDGGKVDAGVKETPRSTSP